MHNNSVILCIADTHFPYHHQDTFRFLLALNLRFKPTRVIHLGDELDNSALSFHEKDPDAPSAMDEFLEGKKCMKKMCDIFPKIDFLESNHGSLAYRRAKFSGIPARYIKNYHEILELDPDKYVWHKQLKLDIFGKKITFIHGFGSNALVYAKEKGTCLVQGHSHTIMNVSFFGDEYKPKFSMQVGCLIDNSSSSFDYNKKFSKLPRIGAAIIIQGYPMLIPMNMNNSGRFTEIYDGGNA